MKGNKQIIEKLNTLLADELTAVNQYIVHSEMCANWGYSHLHDTIKGRAIGEMKHAEKLIERILFLEGVPSVGYLNEISIGTNIEEQFRNDQVAEQQAVKAYNHAINLAVSCDDSGYRRNCFVPSLPMKKAILIGWKHNLSKLTR